MRFGLGQHENIACYYDCQCDSWAFETAEEAVEGLMTAVLRLKKTDLTYLSDRYYEIFGELCDDPDSALITFDLSDEMDNEWNAIHVTIPYDVDKRCVKVDEIYVEVNSDLEQFVDVEKRIIEALR